MVIIPTEKRFDWKHTPLVLISLVVINILIFFMYQSGDDEKIDKALTQYGKLNYLEIEWPIFQKYLSYKNHNKQLSEYRRYYQQGRYEEVSYYLLVENDFQKYLYRYRHDLENVDDLDVYLTNRERVNELLHSVSYLSYGLTPNNPTLFSFLTSQFLHGDIMHLLGNLFFLVICGFAVEAAIGHYRFLAFYLISGIAGGLLHMLLNANSSSPLIGASGAISGVMAMYLGVFRFKKIEFFYWFFAFVGYFRAPALLILPLYIGKEVVSYFGDNGSNVAFMAHTGGFLAGILLMLFATSHNPKVLNEEYIEENQDINPLQEKLAKVYLYIERFQFQSAYKSLLVIIEQHGLNFEFAMIKYNLLKPEKNKDYLQAVLELLKIEKLPPYQLAQVEMVWLENPLIQKLLKADELYQLGWSFISLTDVSTAENIFDQLINLQYEKAALSRFAIKLSIAYEAKNNRKRKLEFEEIAASFI